MVRLEMGVNINSVAGGSNLARWPSIWLTGHSVRAGWAN